MKCRFFTPERKGSVATTMQSRSQSLNPSSGKRHQKFVATMADTNEDFMATSSHVQRACMCMSRTLLN